MRTYMFIHLDRLHVLYGNGTYIQLAHELHQQGRVPCVSEQRHWWCWHREWNPSAAHEARRARFVETDECEKRENVNGEWDNQIRFLNCIRFIAHTDAQTTYAHTCTHTHTEIRTHLHTHVHICISIQTHIYLDIVSGVELFGALAVGGFGAQVHLARQIRLNLLRQPETIIINLKVECLHSNWKELKTRMDFDLIVKKWEANW